MINDYQPMSLEKNKSILKEIFKRKNLPWFFLVAFYLFAAVIFINDVKAWKITRDASKSSFIPKITPVPAEEVVYLRFGDSYRVGYTDNWKVYMNRKYGYSVKFPENWHAFNLEIEKKPSEVRLEKFDNGNKVLFTPDSNLRADLGNKGFLIEVKQNNGGFKAKDYVVEEVIPGYKKEGLEAKVTRIKLDKDIDMALLEVNKGGQITSKVVVPQGDNVLVFSPNLIEEEVFNYVLSTVELMTAIRTDVSYTKVGDNIYLRYKSKVYVSDKQINTQLETVEIDQTNCDWTKLLEESVYYLPYPGYLEGLFSFKVFQDNKKFVFVMINSSLNEEVEDRSFLNDVYVYNIDDPRKGVKKVISLGGKDAQKMGLSNFFVARIENLTNNGRYLTLAIFPCWESECSAGKLLLDLETSKAEYLGYLAYFSWIKDNGDYEYKVLPDCALNWTEGCEVDIGKLPMHKGHL